MRAFFLGTSALLIASCASTTSERPAVAPGVAQSSTLLPVYGSELADGAGRSALIIGNADYVALPSLDNPGNDAELLARTLSDLDYEVYGGGPRLNLTGAEMATTVSEFVEEAKARGGMAVIYYAGHGIQAQGVNYLVPVDADIDSTNDLSDQTLDLQAVLDELEAAGLDLNVVIVDACRDLPISGSAGRDLEPGLSAVAAPAGSVVAFSTDPGNVAFDGQGARNSPYAEALVEAMKRPGMRIEDAFTAVRNIVSASTGGQQFPWETSAVTTAASFAGPILSIDDIEENTEWDGRYLGKLQCSNAGASSGFDDTSWFDIIGGRMNFKDETIDGRWRQWEFRVGADGRAAMDGAYFHSENPKRISFRGTFSGTGGNIAGPRGPRYCSINFEFYSPETGGNDASPNTIPNSAMKLMRREIIDYLVGNTLVYDGESHLLYLRDDFSYDYAIYDHRGKLDENTGTWSVDGDRFCTVSASEESTSPRCRQVFVEGDRYYSIRQNGSQGVSATRVSGDVTDNFSQAAFRSSVR